MQWVESHDSLSRRTLGVTVRMTDSYVVGRSINEKIDIDSGNNVASPGFEKARHRICRRTICLRQIGQCELFCGIADGDLGASNIAKRRASLPRDEEVVVIARDIGPDTETVSLLVERPFLSTIVAVGANHKLSLVSLDVDVRRSVHERRLHHGLAAALPFDCDGTIAVIF